ncbi:MAG: hypothetical protein WBG71_07255 [Leeuwenhoekiella sp.]
MKHLNSITILAILAFSIPYSIQAKIWRVNNQSNFDNTANFGENYGGSPAYPVFKEINDAVQNPNVIDGDTLYVAGSSALYENAEISKRLVIIGPGYFLTENEAVSKNVASATLDILTFDVGSTGSQIIGFSFDDNSRNDVVIRTSDITVKLCRFEGRIIFSAAGIIETMIVQCFLTQKNTEFFSASNTNNVPSNIIFNNNIVQRNFIWEGNLEECNNNIFDGPPNELAVEVNAGSFKNNILKAPGSTANINNGSNANVSHNTVSNAAALSGTPNLIVEPSMGNLFVGGGSTDGQYQLKEGASANQPGSDGSERGAFGGQFVHKRYTLSGLPPIPVLYGLITSGVSQPGEGLPIEIKARIVE